MIECASSPSDDGIRRHLRRYLEPGEDCHGHEWKRLDAKSVEK